MSLAAIVPCWKVILVNVLYGGWMNSVCFFVMLIINGGDWIQFIVRFSFNNADTSAQAAHPRR